MPIQATDIALFLVSFAACIYCIVLSRRLQVLQNTKDGLGATILALSESISTMAATTQETRLHATDLATRLADLMQDAQRACRKIEGITSDLESRHSRLLAASEQATGELGVRLQQLSEEAQERIDELTTLTDQVRTLTDATTETILEAIHRAADRVTEPRQRRMQRYES